MASRRLILFAFAALITNSSLAAPAIELSGVAPPSMTHSPLSLQTFLLRSRQPVVAARSDSAGYVPRTTHDNSQYRFDMTQNGRRMTAEEFGAWMKARGIRVATGRPAGSEPTTATPAAGTVQACQPTATTNC